MVEQNIMHPLYVLMLISSSMVVYKVPAFAFPIMSKWFTSSKGPIFYEQIHFKIYDKFPFSTMRSEWSLSIFMCFVWVISTCKLVIASCFTALVLLWPGFTTLVLLWLVLLLWLCDHFFRIYSIGYFFLVILSAKPWSCTCFLSNNTLMYLVVVYTFP